MANIRVTYLLAIFSIRDSANSPEDRYAEKCSLDGSCALAEYDQNEIIILAWNRQQHHNGYCELTTLRRCAKAARGHNQIK